MAKAKKLPSGSWRVQVYAGTVDGKRQYKSFTARTARKAELAALAWQEHYREVSRDTGNMTVSEAIDAYIRSKSNILSPATIRGYEVVHRNRLQSLMEKQIGRLTQSQIQAAINEEAKTCSPKTVRNAFGLLSAILNEYRPDWKINIKLPQKVPFEGTALTSEQISALLHSVEKYPDIEIPVLLALWLGLRRSEILGLRWENIDLKNQTLYVREARVPDVNGHLVTKNPKTVFSNRALWIPDYIAEKLKRMPHDGEYIMRISGSKLQKDFKKLCLDIGVPELRFHDLRHTMASVGLRLNIADKYMMERGGWGSINTMKKIYQQTVDDASAIADREIESYFMELMQHEMQHKK